jgi:hypothetical protein
MNPPPHPCGSAAVLNLAGAISGNGGPRAGFAPFVPRTALGAMAHDHALTRLAQFVAARMAEAVERHEAAVRLTPAGMPWASAALVEEAKALLSARGYTVSDIENDQGQNVGWRVAW